MGNQHSNQLNLKQLNKKIKQKSRLKLSSGLLPTTGNKNKIKEKGSAFLCHSNGSLIANVQFKCNFCSTVKRSSFAIRQHYAKRHHFFESSQEQLAEIEPKDYLASGCIEQSNGQSASSDRCKKANCTLFIQDNDLIIRCSTLNYGVLKLDEHEADDQTDNQQRVDQLESDLRLQRINELSKLRQELTKLNAFSRLVESAEKDNQQGPVRGHSIRIRKFDDDASPSLPIEDQLNNNHYYSIKSKDDKFMIKERKIPNSASDGTNSSTSSLCHSDVEHTDDHLFGLADELTKEAEQHLSETSSVDTTFGLDARCTVCSAKNYVVCIQSRLGKLICANCFRFFRRFLSEPMVYACTQLGKCELNKPIKPMSYHASHQQRKLTNANTTAGTASKHVVKQQQLGIFKSKSNTLQSTPKARRPLQQKELSFYSIASYGNSNNNSLTDQSKSMTLNPSKHSYAAYKERNLSPTNQSNWTTPSPTQSNVSFALKYSNSAQNDLDANFSSSFSAMNTFVAPPLRTGRCNACWIKKCIEIYFEVQFDEKIMRILHDFAPIQLTPSTDELKQPTNYNYNQLKTGQQSSTQLNQPPQNSTLTKQKRYYTNNKLKSKSVSRLYYNATANTDKSVNSTTANQSKLDAESKANTLSAPNRNTNGLTSAKPLDQSANQSPTNNSLNESNCSNSIMKDSNDSNNESNTTIDSNNKSDCSTSSTASAVTPPTATTAITTNGLNGSKTNRHSSIPTPISKTHKSNGKLSNNRSSNASSSSFKTGLNKNTITLNNLPFKSNVFSSINKANKQHASILPAKSNSGSSNSTSSTPSDGHQNGVSEETKSAVHSEINYNQRDDCDVNNQDKQCGDHCASQPNGDSEPLSKSEEIVNENEVVKSFDQNNTVRLVFKSEYVKEQENINTIEVLNGNPVDNEFTNANHIKLTTVEHGNLNLLLNTNIHNIPERV